MRGHRLSGLLLSLGGFLCLLWAVLLWPAAVEARPPLQATDQAPALAQGQPLTMTVVAQDQNGNAILRVEPGPTLTQTILLFFPTPGLDLATPPPQWPLSPTVQSNLLAQSGATTVVALASEPVSVTVVVSETYGGEPLTWQLREAGGVTVVAAGQLSAADTAMLRSTVPPAVETPTPTATASPTPTIAPSPTLPPPTPLPTEAPATSEPPPATEAAPAVAPLPTDEPDAAAGGGLLAGLGSRNLLLIALIGLLMLLLILLLIYLLFRLFSSGSPPAPSPVPAGPAPVPPGSPVLLFGENGRAVPIDELPFSIGRAEDNNLAIRAGDHPAAATVSRHHALIERQGGEYVITDRGSQNGIQVNDRPTARNLLRDGWQVSIGGVPFTFYTQPPGESGGASR